jgi:SAM-dependent methyltransferase
MRSRLRAILEHFGVEFGYLRLRRKGYDLLTGTGLEIGALNQPAMVPRRCNIEYVDVITRAEAMKKFPELEPSSLIEPDHILDVDSGGLNAIAPATFDFAIANHVVEHVANPGRFIAELVALLKPGGRLVIAAPDKNYTFDRPRPLTPLETLARYYFEGRPPVGPDDYRDVVAYGSPEVMDAPAEVLRSHLESHCSRREHLSVWTDATFRVFLVAAFGWCGATMVPLYEVPSELSHVEYFAVWEKQPADSKGTGA